MSNIPINGPFVIGYTLCFSFMGALAVQAYIYYTRFTDDRKAIKTLVTTILLLETLMTVFAFYAFWGSSTSSTYASVDPLILGPLGPGVLWSFIALAPITGLVTTLTHGFFCWRIASLRQSRLLPLPIMMVSLLQLASITCLAFTDDPFPSKASITMYSSFQSQISITLSPWLVIYLGSSVVCDLAITISMLLSLRSSKSHFRTNKSILIKLTRLTIETGLVTAVAALLELILALVYRDYFYHVAVFYAISKLYANCLLASLNFRLVLRSQSEPSLTAIVWDDMASNTQSRQQPVFQPSHVMQILTQVETHVDMGIELNETGPSKNSSVSSVEDPKCGLVDSFSQKR